MDLLEDEHDGRVLVYGITDDPNRTCFSHLRLDYGERVQKSVFEADLDADAVKEILKRAANYLAAGDSLRLYPQCKTCNGRAQFCGRPTTVGVHIESESLQDREQFADFVQTAYDHYDQCLQKQIVCVDRRTSPPSFGARWRRLWQAIDEFDKSDKQRLAGYHQVAFV